jgi:hypothetical protein
MTEQPPQPGRPGDPSGPTPGDPLGAGSPAAAGPPQPPPAPVPAGTTPAGTPTPSPAVGYPAAPGPVAAPPAVAYGYPIKRPLGRVFGLSILSFGLYGFYWFYATRKQLNQELGKTEDAGLYTAGLVVPILNYFIIYWLWRDLNELRVRGGLAPFNAVAYILLAIFVPFAVIVVYALVANRLNEYWDVRTAGQATDAPVTTAEKVIVAVGALFWLFLALIVVIILIVAASSG